VNKLRARKEDLTWGPQNGFMNVKGGDVLKPTADGSPVLKAFPDRFQAASDDIGKGLSPRAMQMFRFKAADELTSYKTELARHTLQQTEHFEQSVFKDTLGTATNEAARYSSDPGKLLELSDRVEKATRTFAASNGLKADAMVQTARSNVYAAAVNDLIAKNDPAALALYNSVKGNLDANDLTVLGGKLKTFEVNQVARSYVADLNVDEGARRDQVIKSFVADGYSHADGAAFAANFFHESRFRTNVPNKGDGRDGSDSINMGQWNGPRAIAFKAFAAARGLDENDPKAAIAYAKAELDGTIPNSVSGVDPGLKDRFKAAKTAEEKAAILSQGFFKPRDEQGNMRVRGDTAKTFAADYLQKNDPLAGFGEYRVAAARPAQGRRPAGLP
jgi:hypothetical protein